MKIENEMTNEKMNRAIAEHLGWTRIWDPAFRQWTQRSPDGTFAICDPDPNSQWEMSRIPNYAEDLNAMHEAEKAAFKSSTLWVEFAFNLLTVLQASEMPVADGMTCVLQATAAQRAEAFLRTVGKWVEPKGDE